MSATLSTLARPAQPKSLGLRLLFSAGWKRISSYLDHRATIASLRELDDRALHDIGLERSQIEVAARGVMIPHRRARA